MESSIHKVAHKYVVGFRALSSYFEQLHQIVELTMDVTTNLNKSKNE